MIRILYVFNVYLLLCSDVKTTTTKNFLFNNITNFILNFINQSQKKKKK